MARLRDKVVFAWTEFGKPSHASGHYEGECLQISHHPCAELFAAHSEIPRFFNRF